MGQTGKPEWVKHILNLLRQAKEADEDLERFGADAHAYKLASPAKEEAIQKFEQKYGIGLPEEYRDFLRLVGNGGAGPFYGLFGLKKLRQELEDSDISELLAQDVMIHPKMSDEEWEEMIDSVENPYTGILPIESQGCTLMTGLVLNGPYRGRVVYYDEDLCGQPFFMREAGFLAWYERWLREVIAGYDDEEQEFGISVDGNPQQLMELYQQTSDAEEKADIVDSYYKFDALPQEQEEYFCQMCAHETDRTVQMHLVKMLFHFGAARAQEEAERLWECGAWGEVITVISEEGNNADREKWIARTLEKMPVLCGEPLRNACGIIGMVVEEDQRASRAPRVCANSLRAVLLREDLDRNERIMLFYCMSHMEGKEEVLDYFQTYLPAEEDINVLNSAVQAMGDVRDPRMLKMRVMLLDKYRNYENAVAEFQGSQRNCAARYIGAHRQEGQLVGLLLEQLDLFGLDYPDAWMLLMDNARWDTWKREHCQS